jgi:hypothetical protein
MSRADLPGAIPEPVATYVRATNAGDLDALLETFADHALVNDQLHEYWDKAAITEWAARDIVDQHLTMDVQNVVTNNGQIVVTAILDGRFDRRGLPEPLVVAFYFSVRGDKIVQLLILRNESDE